jgi:hypothetical protein
MMLVLCLNFSDPSTGNCCLHVRLAGEGQKKPPSPKGNSGCYNNDFLSFPRKKEPIYKEGIPAQAGNGNK